jgi:hypothetical protein
MASLCTLVILGGKNPLVVLLTSNRADAAGVAVPIPTCAYKHNCSKTKMGNTKIVFFMIRLLGVIILKIFLL